MNRLPWKRSLFLLLTLVIAVGTARADEPRADEGRADERVFAKALPSSVWVLVPEGTPMWNGTGCLVDQERRLVLTCKHVVKDQKRATVFFPLYEGDRVVTDAEAYLRAKTGIRARVLAVDGKRDLALLQLDRLPDGVAALPLADESPAPGQVVFGIGNSGNTGKPLGQGSCWKQYQGKVNRVAFSMMFLANVGQTMHSWTVEMAADVKPGDSGGPLVDDQGRLVGVVNAEDKDKGYAVDIEEVRLFLDRAVAPKHGPAANDMVGHWNVQFQKDKLPPRFFKMTMDDDGQLLWVTDKAYPGRFELKDNRLTVVVPSLQLNDTLTITQHDDGRVTFVSSGVEFTMTRR